MKKEKLTSVIKNHIQLIDKTAKYPTKIENYSLGYLVSGIGDEYGEFVKKSKQFYENFEFKNEDELYRNQNSINKNSLKECYKEAGDVLWYINTLIIKVLNKPLDDKFYNKIIDNLNSLPKAKNKNIYNDDYLNKIYNDSGFSISINSYKLISKLLGISKKFYRDSKPLDNNLILEILNYIVCSILSDLNDIVNYYYEYQSEKYLESKKAGKLILKKVINLNIEKLIKRNETNTIHGDGDNREEQVKVEEYFNYSPPELN